MDSSHLSCCFTVSEVLDINLVRICFHASTLSNPQQVPMDIEFAFTISMARIPSLFQLATTDDPISQQLPGPSLAKTCRSARFATDCSGSVLLGLIELIWLLLFWDHSLDQNPQWATLPFALFSAASLHTSKVPYSEMNKVPLIWMSGARFNLVAG